MRHVNVKGTLKVKGKQSHIDIEGWLQDNFFYTDRNNATMFYIVSYCHRTWQDGILIQYIEDLDID